MFKPILGHLYSVKLTSLINLMHIRDFNNKLSSKDKKNAYIDDSLSISRIGLRLSVSNEWAKAY